MSEDPFHPVMDARRNEQDPTRSVSSGRAVYNLVSDTVTGVNVRWSDNRFQAMFVLYGVVLASLIGAVVVELVSRWGLPWFGGALIGGFAGMVIGILVSGFCLMVYRAARHLRGKHD